MSLDKHYSFEYKGVRMDPYRIFKIYGITDPAQQHAIKKLLRAGQSTKSLKQDIAETILTLNRWLDMMEEDAVPDYRNVWPVARKDGECAD